jgi:hypothetical protein
VFLARSRRAYKFEVAVEKRSLRFLLDKNVNEMKPGEVRIVGSLNKILIRYGHDGIVTVVSLRNGLELYRR